MQHLPHESVAPLLTLGAMLAGGFAATTVVHRKIIRSWWWIGFAAQAVCVYMLIHTARTPSESWVPVAVGAATALWETFFLYAVAADVGHNEVERVEEVDKARR